MESSNDLPMEDTEEESPPPYPTQEEQDKIGYCIRCLAPKPDSNCPDLCKNCENEIDHYLKKGPQP